MLSRGVVNMRFQTSFLTASNVSWNRMRFSFGEAVVMAWPEISYSRNIYRNVI